MGTGLSSFKRPRRVDRPETVLSEVKGIQYLRHDHIRHRVDDVGQVRPVISTTSKVFVLVQT